MKLTRESAEWNIFILQFPMRLVVYTTFLFYLYIWLKVVHKMNDISKLQFKSYHNGNIFVLLNIIT